MGKRWLGITLIIFSCWGIPPGLAQESDALVETEQSQSQSEGVTASPAGGYHRDWPRRAMP